LNGVIDFIGAGYKAYDQVRGIAKSIGGENYEKKFDEFSKQFNIFANLAIVAGLAATGGTDFGFGRGKGGGGKPSISSKGGALKPNQKLRDYLNRNSQTKKIEKIYGNDAARIYEGRRAQGASQKRALADVKKRFKPLTERYGVQRGLAGGTGKGAILSRGLGKAANRASLKVLGTAGTKIAKGIFGRVPIIGGLLDFAFALAMGEKPGRAAAKAVGATIGSALGTFIPIPFAGTILGGILGDIVGGALYDTFAGNTGVQKKAQGGQVTKGGKKVGGAIRRNIKKIRRRPPKIQPQRTIPGKDIGGKKEIEKIFPTSKDKTKKDPLGTLEKTSKNLKEIAIAGLSGDVILRTLSSNENIGMGALYDSLVDNKGIQRKAQGGQVTRGGKKVGGAIRRKIKKIRRRPPRIQPQRTIPGKDIGGKKEIEKIFPTTTDPRQKNPLGVLEKTSKNLKEIPMLGGLMGASIDLVMGQKPEKSVFQKIGYGFGALIQNAIDSQSSQTIESIQKQIVGLAGGGVVPRTLSSNENIGMKIGEQISRTFEVMINSKVNESLQSIRRQLNLEGTTKSGTKPGSAPDGSPGGGLAGGAVAPSELYKEIGADLEQWNIYRNSVALIESNGNYSIPGGSGMHYDGRYQMGAAAKKDGSKVAGVDYPGHSDDPNASARVNYRNNPELQETIFTGFTVANHRYLMGNPKYASASVERKLEILGYAHNQGMGNAENWLNTGQVGADGFGTKGTAYTDLIKKNFLAKRKGQELEVAGGAIDVPSEPIPGSSLPSTGVINDRDWNTGIELSTITTKSGKSFQVAKILSKQFQGFIDELEATGYKIKSIGGYRKAGTGGGTGPADPDYDKERYSHPYGASIDINPSQNPYGKSLITDMPDNISEIAARHGLGWGGNWNSVKDAMHFSAMSREGGNRNWRIFKKGGPAFRKYEKGGKVHGLTKAILGEKGPEFVLDADTTAALEQNFPGFLSALNRAKYDDAISVLKNYTSYEGESTSTIMLQRVIIEKPVPMPMGGGNASTSSIDSNMDSILQPLTVG
jgi:hypothetical protein